MTPFNELTLAISAIVLAVTGIVGVILLSTSIFKINSSMKKTVDVIEKYQRPYIAINLKKTNLVIKNTGKSQATIDSIVINDTDEFEDMDGKVINPEQALHLKNDFTDQDELIIEINYHSENKAYKETVSLR
ncbi:hypothetical protein [Companilactobacillus nodensis]|uniref:DUF4352 domain-containing protein n=1 Tax=Companilactobacillus nodensis DSM 19682 = JCM 14932 = NBRC 107160 TaxID=1423775 RepID=A0A0R1KA21_9LACO|nr:hypothetical protein [Companilactobacillus nodensis]KRK80421.1 hypothetical protein FD03_GL001842 [Companilactobacillus nodensis DSM 19682 = JCM 14932 = NBRC 107160]